MLNRLVSPLKYTTFLVWARGTGKSRLLQYLLPAERTLTVNLLEPETYEQYALNPTRLRSAIEARGKDLQWIFIDEVQKLPKLLDLVHAIIEEKNILGTPLYFALTGSSARKLKRNNANMLGGRAFESLTQVELGEKFST